MRKKLAICLGLVLLALLVTVLVVWFMPPAEPPLRKGMTEPEVEAALGVKGCLFGWGRDQSAGIYSVPPDWLGNGGTVWVSFDEAGKVDHWEAKSLPHTRPPWLDKTMKYVGW